MTNPQSLQGPLRFVVLEDDDLDAQLLEACVQDAGLAVIWSRARDEPEFRAALLEGSPDLIISDFSLPGYSGLAALELAQSLTPSVPFLFVSGAIGDERATETLRRGATDYVLKDRMQRLPLAIERALELAHERARRERAEAERDRLFTSERQAREAAETANRLKDEFLATASHELRTPLNAILGWAKLLHGREGEPELLGRGLATIERNALAQARLIEDILDISRIVTGKVQLSPARLAVSAVVSAAVDGLRPAAAAKQIQLSVSVDGAGEIDADPERLQQVLWNLVGNAVKFTQAGGWVNVTAERVDQRLIVKVCDNGQGLEAGFAARVFERFWQADASARRRHGGLGLGLAIVRYLVELHGGRVYAESAGVNQGACFSIELPTTQPVIELKAAPPPTERELAFAGSGVEPQALAGVRVLLVEDDRDSREMLALVLEQHGARVSSAANGVSALEALASSVPDIVISDIGMPELDGYEFMRRVRALPASRGGSVPAVALTAFSREVDRTEAASAGFHGHVAKPVVASVLVKAINGLLGRG